MCKNWYLILLPGILMLVWYGSSSGVVVVVGGTAGHFVAYNDDFGYHLTIHASQFGCKYSLVCALLGNTMMISVSSRYLWFTIWLQILSCMSIAWQFNKCGWEYATSPSHDGKVPHVVSMVHTRSLARSVAVGLPHVVLMFLLSQYCLFLLCVEPNMNSYSFFFYFFRKKFPNITLLLNGVWKDHGDVFI